MTVRSKVRSTVSALSTNRFAPRAVRSGARLAAAIDRGAPATLTILTYHRIAARQADSELSPTMLSATPRELAEQLSAVRSVANPVSVGDVLRCLRGEAVLPPRAVLVTFDDAYADFATDAWPVLRAQGVAPVLFVPTAYPDEPRRAFWWDRLWIALHRGTRPLLVPGLPPVGPDEESITAFRRLRDVLVGLPHHEAVSIVDSAVEQTGVDAPAATVLSWDQLRDLADEGVAIGAHSHTHPLLHRIPVAEAAAEIRRSIVELEARGFEHARVFAYPGGGVDDAVRAAAADAGCEIAVTTSRGVNRIGDLDPLLLRRLNVGAATTPAVLLAQLLPSLARSDRWAGR